MRKYLVILFSLFITTAYGQQYIHGNAVHNFKKTGALVVLDTLGDTTFKHNSDGSFTSITNDASGRNGIHWDGVNNRTGINTKTPKATLTVSNNDTIPNSIGRLQIVNNNGGNAVIDLMGFGAPAMFVGRRSNGTAGTPIATDSGNVLAGFYGRGYGATGYFANNRGGIEVVAAETHTNTNQGTYINFNVTGKSGGSYYPKMRLYDNGHLVISDAPVDTGDNFRLQVAGNAMVNDDLEVGVNIRTSRIFVKDPTVAIDIDSIVVKQNGEYVPALASRLVGGKVDSITKSNDTFYYWKLGTKYFSGLDVSATGGGSGTVTSVSMTTPTWLTVSGSPVTTSGTLAVTAATGQTANRFLATPDGSTGAVSLRAIATGDLPTGINAANLADGSVSNTEYQYIGGLTSDAQTQLDGKAASSHTHAQSDITNLTTDLAGKQASDADLTAIAALTPTNDDIIQRKAGAWVNRSIAQLKTDLNYTKGDVGLGNVENTALSTWAGSVNIATVGTISSGTWNGGVIPGQYGGTGVANTGKTITVSGNTTIGSSTNTVTLTTTGNTNVTLPTSGTLATTTGAGLPVEIGIAVSDETTAITTGTAKVTFRMPHAMTVTAVRANVNTVSSSGTPTVDINEGGSSILGTKLTIDASEKTSTTAASAATITDASLADDAEITIDIDVAGTGAKGLKVWIIGTR